MEPGGLLFLSCVGLSSKSVNIIKENSCNLEAINYSGSISMCWCS